MYGYVSSGTNFILKYIISILKTEKSNIEMEENNVSRI